MAETQETTGESTETGGESTGQSEATSQTTASGTGDGGESFFDYESVKGTPNEAAYKEMQRAFSKKTEVLKAGADKIRQYDQYVANPVESIKAFAAQNGYQLVQGQPKDQNGESQKFENWDDVMGEAERRVMDKLQPMLGEMQNMKKQSVEQSLDTNHPDWRTYEDGMMANLQAHPSLVSDPDMLYRMSVPEEVLAARANKAALDKIQGTTESGKVQGQSTTTQKTNKTPKIESFDDAVKFARQELSRQGIAPPRGE